MRLADYYRLDYRFSYLRTPSDVEIDLIVERPGKKILCIEIKSAARVSATDISQLRQLSKDIPNSEAICLCQEKYPRKIEHVTVLPWKQGIAQYFKSSFEE